MAAVQEECRELELDLAAAQRIGESLGFADRIISRGEILSSRFMQALLRDRGIASKVVDLSEAIISEVSDLDQKFYEGLAETLAKEVEACGAKVPIITGYFGSVPGGLLNKIGRGYTDLCAALVAVGLHAKELEIWKEVDGVFTAVSIRVICRLQIFETYAAALCRTRGECPLQRYCQA